MLLSRITAIRAAAAGLFLICFSALADAQVGGNQQGDGWRGSGAGTSQDRYGATDPAATSPFTASNPAPSGAPSNFAAGLGNQPLQQQPPITPIPGGAGPMTGMQPVQLGVTRAQVSTRAAALPSDHGQQWRDYDIRPYTQRAVNTARPEQAIVDWILRETGYEAWHTEPLGLLSASRDTLRVYHTPEMHAIVADIADRFVSSAADTYSFSLRIATVRSPNWRARALPRMTPIPVQSPGVQGWLLAKEDAALIISELSRRTDYREYNSAQQLVANGQSFVISTMRPRTYIRGIVPTQHMWPGYQPDMGQIEEGFAMEFSPLTSLDMQSTDAVVKLRLNQVEKMVPVKLDIPNVVAPNQQVQVEVPQMTMANLHERFRWPTDKVLLLSMGVVATPTPTTPGRPNPIVDFFKDPPRADALLMVESKGRVITAPTVGTAPISSAMAPRATFQGRY